MQRKNKSKGCCKNRMIINSLLALFMFLALALNSYALSCGIQSPANNGVISEGTIINISYGNNGGFTTAIDTIRIYVNISSSRTANSSTSTMLFFNVNSSNASATAIGNIQGAVNQSLGALGVVSLEDDSQYTLNCYCENRTTSGQTGGGSTACNATRTVSVDRTVPQTPTSPSPTGRVTSNDQTFSATVNGGNTSNCLLIFTNKNPGNSQYPMTHSGTTCTQAFTNLPQTTYDYIIRASDGTNVSETTLQSTEVDVRTATAKKAYISSGGQLPSQASSTAQQRAGGQQASNVLDDWISKAPPEAQQGLTKAKESITKQYKGFEAVKTWTGTGIGCTAGLIGLIIPPVGMVTIPAGCIGGHIVGMIV